MIEFEDFISDTCKEYFEKHPDLKPNKLAQIQYILGAYYNDVSIPPTVPEMIEYLKANVYKDDPYYEDVQKHIRLTESALDEFKKQEDGYVYVDESGSYIFGSYLDTLSFIDEYVKVYNDFDPNDSDPYEEIIISKVKMYDKSISMTHYCDYKYKFGQSVHFNMDKEIVYIHNDKYNLFSYPDCDEDDYPELSKFQKVHVPYEPGDILLRKGRSRNYPYYPVEAFIMLYKFNEDLDKIPREYWSPHHQISMGEFSGRKFDYGHEHCIYEFEKFDVDEWINSIDSTLWKGYREMIKKLSLEIKENYVDFQTSFDTGIKLVNNFIASIESINDWEIR